MPDPRTLTITIPWPSSKLDPNKRHHWRAKLKPKAEARRAAWAECVRHPGHHLQLETARVDVVAYHKTKTFRDPQNIIALLKHSIDGIEDAGVIVNDNGLAWGVVDRRKDAANPRVVLTITDLSGQAAEQE